MITKSEFERIYRQVGAPYVNNKPPLGELMDKLTEAGMEWREESVIPELEACPACGGSAHCVPAGWVACSTLVCQLLGPINDPTGEKWNALPRR